MLFCINTKFNFYYSFEIKFRMNNFIKIPIFMHPPPSLSLQFSGHFSRKKNLSYLPDFPLPSKSKYIFPLPDLYLSKLFGYSIHKYPKYSRIPLLLLVVPNSLAKFRSLRTDHPLPLNLPPSRTGHIHMNIISIL